MDTTLRGKVSFLVDGVPIQTSLEIIQKKVLAYHGKMNKVAKWLEENGAPNELQIRPEEIFLEFYIDRDAINRLFFISLQRNFSQFGVFFALEDPESQSPPINPSSSFGRPTACFLGLDIDNNILGCHFPKIPVGSNTVQKIDGEDTWPPPPPPGAAEEGTEQEPTTENQFTLATDEDIIRQYFERDITAESNAKSNGRSNGKSAGK